MSVVTRALSLVGSDYRRYVLVIGYATALFAASIVPLPESDPTPGPFGLVGLDKWIHGVGYAALAVLLARARRARAARSLLVLMLAAIGYGLGVEVVQALVPTRTFSTADAGANALGATLGTLARVGYLAVQRRRAGG